VIGAAVNGKALVAVTGQTVGRIGSSSDRVDNFLTRAVVTGRTGTGAVGRNIMFGPFDLSPGGNDVTVAAQLTRGGMRQVARAFGNGMRMDTVDGGKAGRMTGRTVAGDR